MRADPIGLAGGINLFAYANLNPLNSTDPNGLLADGGIISGPAAYFVAGAIAGGILYYGAPIAEDIGKWLGGVLWNENNEDEGESCDGDNDKIEETIQGIEDYIGDGKVIHNDNGDLVIVSSDGQRRVGIDLNNPHPHQNPHGHVEEKINGQWDKSGPIYPKDVPHY